MITLDRGTQFMSELWSQLCQLLGVELRVTLAYHPQTNGLIERLHRSLKESLKARLFRPAWLDQLPWVLLGLHSVPKENLGCSDLVYGATITLPGDFIVPTEKEMVNAEFIRRLRADVRSWSGATCLLLWTLVLGATTSSPLIG